ncbi:MAG: Coenzyme F420 hydrogenase/dehydrogenase, beta subunit C-terminal domain [Candidatus Helarchaeota archaeon]
MAISVPILDKKHQSLCTSCGACIAVCPEDAIKMGISKDLNLVPIENSSHKCTKCDLCRMVCPCLNPPIISNKESNIDYVIGPWINAYKGYAQDIELRRNGSSGGVATAILIELIKSGLIDGAVVTVPNKDNPFLCNTILATNINDILKSQQSRYTQVDFSSGLKEINDVHKGHFAIVGLPCHLAAITKWTDMNRTLKDKVYLKIGLFCGRGVSCAFPKFIAEFYDIDIKNLIKINYRDGNWKDFIFSYIGKSKNEYLKFNDSIINKLWSNYFFSPLSCYTCDDGFAEFADVSVGDAWNITKDKMELGTSIVISRSSKGQRILDILKENNSLSLYPINKGDVIKSQKDIVFNKKGNIIARRKIWKFFGMPLPSSKNNIKERKIGLREYIIGISVLLIYKLSFFLYRFKILKVIPKSILNISLKITSKFFSLISNINPC